MLLFISVILGLTLNIILEYNVVILLKVFKVILFLIKIGGLMLSYIIGTLRNMESMISDIFSLLDRKDLDQFRYVNRLVCNQFAWISVLAGYDSAIFRYVEKKLNFYFRYVIYIKKTHKHAPNFL